MKKVAALIVLAVGAGCASESSAPPPPPPIQSAIHPDLAQALASANGAGKLLLVDFFGAWCPWCVKMDESLGDPQVQAILEEKFYYYKLDIGHFDRHQGCVQFYGVKGIPHVIIFNGDGTVRGVGAGYMDPAALAAFLRRWSGGKNAAPSVIHADLREALRQANSAGKLLLVDFYGDWCPWCVKLDESLADPDVQAALEEGFYYYKLDIGRFERHKGCLSKYQVKGIPHLIVFNSDGTVRTSESGYKAPQDFLAFLKRNP